MQLEPDTLDLGGKSPQIFLADLEDLDRALGGEGALPLPAAVERALAERP